MTKTEMTVHPMRTGIIVAAWVVSTLGVSTGAATAAAQARAADPAKASPTKAAGAPAINVQQLAVADRALEFCGPIDPDSSKKLKEQIATLLKGASADDVAQARASDTYKEAYSNMDGFIGQIDPRNAKTACANTANGPSKGKGK